MLFVVKTGQATTLDTLIEIDGKRLTLKVEPEGIVFLEK